MRQNGIIGTVTAVSSTSISANDARSGSESTKTINSSTTISNNGAGATVNDINVGDQVLIQTSSSDASIATLLVLTLACLAVDQIVHQNLIAIYK